MPPTSNSRIPIFLDYETRIRGEADSYLRVHGPYRYAEHPHFAATLMGVRIGDEPTQVVSGAGPIEEMTRRIVGMASWGTHRLVAHNSMFDRLVASRLLGMPTGQYLDPAHWDDTMPRAQLAGLPASLAGLADTLGAPSKMREGKTLIARFGGSPELLADLVERYPEDWATYIEYNRQDVDTLAAVDGLVSWPRPQEYAGWVLDQRINDHGVEIDTTYCRAADAVAHSAQQRDADRIREITGVDNPASIPQLKDWFHLRGFYPPDLQRETLQKHLPAEGEQMAWLKEHRDRKDLPDDVMEVIRLKVAGGVVTRWSKMLDWVCSDGRLRGAYRFAAAHTGRWSSRGAQLHNMSRESVGDSDAAVDTFVAQIKSDAAHPADNAWSLRDLRGGLRPALVGPFTVVDFSAIEARVLPWLTGEEDILELFRKGKDVYVDAARRIGLRVPDEVTDHAGYKRVRGQGKVMTLAAGYGGGPATLRAQGAVGTDRQIKDLAAAWKRSRRPVTQLWADLEKGLTRPVRRLRGVSMRRGSHRSRDLVLPSGRVVHYPRVRESLRGGYRYDKPQGGWGKLWGGTLTNNLCQATARDLLLEAMLRLDNHGFTIVGHVHDEVLVEGRHNVDEIIQIMRELPPWAHGLPLSAEGYQCSRYRKE